MQPSSGADFYGSPRSSYYPPPTAYHPSPNAYYAPPSPSLQSHHPPKYAPSTSNKSSDLPKHTYILTAARMMSLVLGFVFLFGLSSPLLSMPVIPYFEDASTLNTLPNIVVYTVFATIIAKPALGGLGEVFQLISQHRLSKFRSIFEIEIWTKLASGSVFLAWEGNWRRWAATLATLLVATIHGLYISGFVSLLTPQLTLTASQVVNTFQLDFVASSPTCASWYEGQLQALKACEIQYSQLNLTYKDCQVGSQIFGALEAARASMLSHIAISTQSSDPQRYTSSLSRLGSTRIMGSTAAVIPMGPYGMNKQAISAEIATNSTKIDFYFTSLVVPVRQSKPGRYINYTLGLQGIDADVSCMYDDNPGSHTAWSSELPERQLSVVAGNSSLSDNTWIYYLRTCLNDCGTLISTSPESAYAGIGSMTCFIKPRLQEINTTYDSNLEAFIMKPIDDSSTTGNQPTQILDAMSSLTQQVLVHSSTRHGSAIASSIDHLAVSEYGLPGGVKNEKYPALIASMIKGVFEYEGTLLRLNLTNSIARAPDECRRPVQGTTFISVTAVKDRDRPILTLVLMTTVCVISAIGLLWSSWVAIRGLKKGLPFDPTLVISLVGASAAGGLQFGEEVVGEPEDTTVRNTKVKYAALSTYDDEPDRWGLVALDGGKNGSES